MAAAVGLANIVLLPIEASALVHSLYLNADDASALVLPALDGHAPAGAIVNLGNHPWYEPWLFMRATAGLPRYRQLWELAPFFFALLGIASVVACVWRALGRSAAVLTGVALVSASDALRGVYFVPEARVALILHMGVFCGALLWAHERAATGRLSWRAAVVVGVPLVVFSGFGLTDQLVGIAALIPFVAAPLACWWRQRSREYGQLALFALASGALALLAGHVVTRTMEAHHVIHAPFPIRFVSATAIVAGVENAVTESLALGGGSFFGLAAGGASLFVLAIGLLVLAAFGSVLVVAWRWGAATLAREPIDAASSRREVFVAYWAFALVFVLVSFAFTSVSEVPGDNRYLLGALVAVAALLGLFLAVRPAGTAVVLGVCLFGLLIVRGHLSENMPPGGSAPDQQTAGAIERFVLANGATIGYTGYWQAAPVTWETRLRLKVFPIGPCTSPSPSGLCPFYNNQISSWYSPRADTRTFLITQAPGADPLAVTAPAKAFGTPVAHAALGPYSVWVYDHDLAADP